MVISVGYGMMWLLTRVLSVIPEWFLDNLCRVLAFVAFDVLRVRRELILNNIAIAYPQLSKQERITMGRSSLYHFAVTTLETLLGGVNDFTNNVQNLDCEPIDQAMKDGRGMYILCIHSGNFEVLGSYVSLRWRSVTVPVKHVGRGGVDRFIHAQRLRYNIDPVRTKEKGDGYRAIVKALGEGRPVGFVIDQSRPGQPKIPLFGKPAKTSTSVAGIWRKNPAPLIPLHIKRIKFNHHVVQALPPIHPQLSEDRDKDLLDHSLLFNQAVEALVRMAPEQYWWMHNRWK